MIYPHNTLFPGTLYDGNGMYLAGEGAAQFAPELNDTLPFKSVLQKSEPVASAVHTCASGRL